MARFRVPEPQVQRDHAISHILAALTREAVDLVTFFGGTALSRSYLTDARLSEDIDLIARAPRPDVIEAVRGATSRGLLRSHGRVTWTPDFSDDHIAAAVATTPDGVSIRIQVLRGEGYALWPVELTDLEQRYSDAGPARLWVPTVEAFVGWKTTAWFDRRAPRDLYDLWALATAGRITIEAGKLFAVHGPTGRYPQSFMFENPPTEGAWVAQLAAQTHLTVAANEALGVVRDAWRHAIGELE
jgi:predicted nucleotidyltransferase component of viral defense system